MFGKKREIKTEEQVVQVQTIPADFYGGQNPVVKFKKVEKEVALKPAKILPSEKKLIDKATMAGAGQPAHPANLFANRKFLIIGGLALLVLFIAGASVYYWYQSRQAQVAYMPPLNQIAQQTPPATVPPAETTTPAVETPTTTPTTTAAPPAFSNEAPIEFPSILLGDSADLDKDGLTDAAEEVFGTDPALPDTDGDGYSDSHEVFYLYNPAGKEPMRLIDAGTVKDYTNAGFGYKVYYPAQWAIGEVDPDGRDVLFSTLTGENIEVRVIDRASGQTFADWFAKWAPGEKYGDLVDFETYFKEKGMERKDGLVYYLMDNNYVYVIVYHTTDSNIVNYRSIIQMMARSFRTKENPRTIVPSAVPPQSPPAAVQTTTAATGAPESAPATPTPVTNTPVVTTTTGSPV